MSCPSLKQAAVPGIQGPVVLAIMDGVALGRQDEGNAVAAAATPTLDRLARDSMAFQLQAHGLAVGLPSNKDMGNSEVGHNAMGAGRVFAQGAKLAADAIDSGRIFAGEVWQETLDGCRDQGTALHFVGLLSDGQVHSHIGHLQAMLERAHGHGVREAYVHALLDGRDVPKTSALDYLDLLEATLKSINAEPGRRYRIASGGGRMQITMDRYGADWAMVERGWRTHVLAEGRQFPSASKAVETLRAEQPGVIDQDLPPFVIAEGGKPVGPIEDGAGVILFNFRGDRMLELTRAFEDEAFAPFERGRWPKVCFSAMTQYDGDAHRPQRFLVAPPEIDGTFSELLCQAGVSQLACSETQKFGHVTYFWNGNRSGAFDAKLERYIEVPSHAPPFDARPEMRAPDIVNTVIGAIAERPFRFVRLNLANGDMVGHTGNFEATVRAVEAVDRSVAKLEEQVHQIGGALVVTADHGNADEMGERQPKTGELLRDENGQLVAKTSHSLNPVPLYLVLPEADRGRLAARTVKTPGLANLAATLATLLGFEPPDHYLPSLVEWLK